LLQVGGVNILTDPIFSERASPVSFLGPKRKVPPALALRDLPHIDVVLISHNHFDHLDLASVRALYRQKDGPPRYFVPLGLKAWFQDNVLEEKTGKEAPGQFPAGEQSKTPGGDGPDGKGASRGEIVVEQDWWEFTDYLGLRIHQVPAQHFSKRSFFDNDEVLWGGFMVEHPDFRFYYSGDTGYSKDIADIAARFPTVDLAVLPIGSYEPRWFMKSMHINPEEAVRIHQDLRARQSVGIHWGTFELTDESMDEPPKALARALSRAGIPSEKFFLLKNGETRLLAPGGSGGKMAGMPAMPP
jgi:L-ascorbate metabolism protein UlaG (beta-lactamase superfamily)